MNPFSTKDVASLYFPLLTNSPVHSLTRSGPASGQSILGSIPSVTYRVLLASGWSGPPSAGGTTGSPAASGGRPIWGTLLFWPPRRGWTAPPAGCSTGSPGRPESEGHCSGPKTAPQTTGGKGGEGEEHRNVIARVCTREIMKSAIHFIMLSCFPFLRGRLCWIFIHSGFCQSTQTPTPVSPSFYLHSIGRWMQSTSLRDLKRSQKEQSGTKQHRTQHGDRDGRRGTETGKIWCKNTNG